MYARGGGGGGGGGGGEDAPKLKNMLRTNVRLSKDEELLFYILYKIMEIISFSAIFFQCSIAYSVEHVKGHPNKLFRFPSPDRPTFFQSTI